MKKKKHTSIKNIHKRIFTVQLVLILTLALFLGISGTLVNLQFEIQKRDQNLQNIAEVIANSPLVDNKQILMIKQLLKHLWNILIH